MRNGSTASNRAVNLIIGGTATPGLDYPAIPTTVTIPAGQATLALLIPAFADDIAVLIEESHTLEGWEPLDPQPAMTVESSGGWDILNFPNRTRKLATSPGNCSSDPHIPASRSPILHRCGKPQWQAE